MTDAEHFANAFSKLTGHAPFGWQCRLFKDWFSLGPVPSDCDIPCCPLYRGLKAQLVAVA